MRPLTIAPWTREFSTLCPNPETDQPRDTIQEPAFSKQKSITPSHLPHLTASGSAHMVSITTKPVTSRTAVAVGRVRFSNSAPLPLIKSNALKKGDVLGVARVAGIMASKKCPEIIPLCHPILLSHVGVQLALVDSGAEGAEHGAVEIEAKVECTGATGVEMEALTAVMAAALTVVDMCKAVDKAMVVEGVTVVLKEGGRSGTWREDGWISRFGT
ncbi:MoaC-domain-containing protein [Mytilinidion resinicola]|uniref:cyclic pyranopterin monophosphate synthase n=1 Tax=Mytilinidion resinicola TaxID=574789 RepID=A0A6A6Z5Z7_9PEZI|nr:MoaC-domain-containing protein [Mytilinidion resinicola]KAF2815635.1 MoaC-domain-containing protein [Mytilinidion resinicola]